MLLYTCNSHITVNLSQYVVYYVQFFFIYPLDEMPIGKFEPVQTQYFSLNTMCI